MAESTPRERRQKRTRQAILDTALEIINEKGPDKLSLREIARRIDYSPAGLYEYFGSKDEIINAVCAEGDRRLVTYLKAVPDDLPQEEYLMQVGLAYIDFARQNRDYFMLNFFRMTGENPPDVSLEQLEAEMDGGLKVAYDLVQRAVEDGFIRVPDGVSNLEITVSFWAFVHGLATLQLINLHGLPFDFEAINRYSLETYLRGLRTKD